MFVTPRWRLYANSSGFNGVRISPVAKIMISAHRETYPSLQCGKARAIPESVLPSCSFTFLREVLMADKEKENYEKDIFDLLEETNGENPNKKDMADRESVLPVEDEPQRGIPARGGSAQGGEETVLQLPIDDVFADPDQPRKAFDRDALADLADSIRKHGVIMPIVVSQVGNRYMIIAGERRYRASRLAGRKTIPAVVKKYSEREIREVSLIENLQREDLNPIEAANAMKKLMDEYSLTQEELSARIGKSRSTVANTLRLLTLSPVVIDFVGSGKLSAGHARALVSLPRPAQEKLARRIVAEGMSVRDVEKAVKRLLSPDSEKKKKKPSFSVELKDMIDRMQRVFGTKVTAVGNDNKGRIYMDYFTRDDLDRIVELLEILEKRDGISSAVPEEED